MRVIVPGVAHHVTQRGNNRELVFHSDWERVLYLRLLTEQCAKYDARILGYCLMSNHVHLLIVPERIGSLSFALARAHSEYALALNRTCGRSGHLWRNRFYSCPLDQIHLVRALLYVDLNPVRAGLVRAAWDWPWSSARAHCDGRALDAVLYGGWREEIGVWNHLEWRDMLAAGLAPEGCEALRRATRTGEPLGSRGFVLDLERQSGRRLRVFERGRPRKPSIEDGERAAGAPSPRCWEKCV